MAYKAVSSTRIYIDLRNLLNRIIDTVPNFPKAYKYTIGEKLQMLAVDLIRDISAAYLSRSRDDRVRALGAFQADFETFKMLVRVSGERRWISGRNAHAEIIELTVNIGRQATAFHALKNGNSRQSHPRS